jgi:digeranylgeranylglycerophospholipid reductase
VLLIEKDQEVGIPVRCAEGISSRAVHAFLGEDRDDLISATIKNVRCTAPGGASILLTQEMNGYVLDRTRFDKVLADNAVASGAELLTSTPATGMVRSPDGWTVTVQIDGSEEKIHAGAVVGADGIESLVGRWAGMKTHTVPGEMESCCQFRLEGVEVEESVIELTFGRRIAPGGYAWVFPKGEGKANVGLGIVRSLTDERITARDFLERWVAKRFPDAVVTDTVLGGVVVGPTLPEISAERLILAGDAAHHINPLSGAGISSGMRAGWLGGNILADQIEKGDLSAKALKRYDTRWRRMLGTLHENHYQLARAIFNTSDEDFDTIAEGLLKVPEHKRNMFTTLNAALKTRPSILVKAVGYFRVWRTAGSEGGYPESPPPAWPAV